MNKTLRSVSLTLLGLFFSVAAMAQITVRGTVTDQFSGDPLPGVNVVDKATREGVITDLDGNYTIQVSGATTLIYSFVGYKSVEQEVSSSTTIDVTLQEDVANLEEVVVTGLASSVKRSNLANAVSTIDAEALTGNTSQATVDGALYGKLTGANIVSSSGAPGGGFAVRLRGISSLNGQQQPLFIIDGVYMDNSEIPSGLRNASGANRGNEENASTRLADLDPNDIQSIEVLKGASAAAIYGTRANAGVVIITTKRGKAGQTQINFSQDVGFNSIIRYLGMRDWNEQRVTDTYGAAEAAAYNAAVANGSFYDYERELYGEKGLIRDSRISVTGGSDKTTFYVGVGRRNENGIVQNTGFQRNSVRLNLDHDITDRIKLSLSSNYVNSASSRGFTGNENEGGLSYGYNLAFTRPWAELHPDEFGNYPDNPNFAGNMLLVRDLAKNEENVNRLLQGVKLSSRLFQNNTTSLRLDLNGGIDYYLNETFVYVPEFHQAQRGLQNGYIGRGRNKVYNGNLQGFLVFDKFLMDGDLSLSTQLGATYLSQSVGLLFNEATQLIPGQVNLNSSGAQRIAETRSLVQEAGLVAQEEVNYRDIFIGTIGVRMDKSTLNGNPNQYFAFPKASLAVNIANMDGWSSPIINGLKPRVAFGQTGSSAGFGSLYTLMNPVQIDGNVGVVVGGTLGAESLVPETSTELEAGIDISAFDSRVAFEASVYQRDVYDLILSRGLPASSGFTVETGNFADLRNRGVELSLTTQNVQNEAISWTSTVNWWTNRSEITRLDVPAFPQPGAGFGLSLGSFYIEEGASITQFKGNIDGVPTTVGDAMPDFQMSLFNQMTFAKNIDFNFLLHWKQGGDILNLTKFLTDLAGTSPDLDTEAGQERIAQGTVATRFIEDGTYLRLREVSLYYTLPDVIAQVEAIKVGVSGRNLFTFTNYSGYDPEVSVNGSSTISTGLDVTPFPSSKQVYFHLNVRF